MSLLLVPSYLFQPYNVCSAHCRSGDDVQFQGSGSWVPWLMLQEKVAWPENACFVWFLEFEKVL